VGRKKEVTFPRTKERGNSDSLPKSPSYAGVRSSGGEERKEVGNTGEKRPPFISSREGAEADSTPEKRAIGTTVWGEKFPRVQGPKKKEKTPKREVPERGEKKGWPPLIVGRGAYRASSLSQ